jgi:transposase-like protein
MKHPPFCTNPDCQQHIPKEVKKRKKKKLPTFHKHGTRSTQAFGPVPRFRCVLCGTTCSSQSFSLDYYAKKVISYQDVQELLVSSTSIRAIGRILSCTPASVLNRIMRFSRQSAAVEAAILSQVSLSEDLVIDGFESYVKSKYHPNNINIAVGADSSFIYGTTYTQLNRKGRMTDTQKVKAAELKKKNHLIPESAVTPIRFLCAQLSRIIDSTPEEQIITINSDLHQSYPEPIGELGSKVVHKQTSSHAPRTKENPLAPVNYADREFRKDLCEQGRKTICYGKNVNNQMERFITYTFWHNYQKKYRINDPKEQGQLRHHTQAGISGDVVKKAMVKMYAKRRFVSHVWDSLSWFHKVWWVRLLQNPEVASKQYVPQYLTSF